MKRVGVGIIGCGVISGAYLKAARKFPILEIVALADANPAAAEARGEEFGIPARSVEALLDDPAIEIVLNLTIPKAHVEVALQAVAAGKHVHSEKPLGIDLDEAGALARRPREPRECASAARRTRSSAARIRPRAN